MDKSYSDKLYLVGWGDMRLNVFEKEMSKVYMSC